MSNKTNNEKRVLTALEEQERNDRIAQWAFDTRPILGRFHIWLEEVETEWIRGVEAKEFTSEVSFLEGNMERLFAMTGAITALGTYIFGRYGEGKGQDKQGLNQVKKDADAISAYAMSESLWYLSRQLPENHAIMVCMGEGLMPKAGETPEQGSNPQLGFGRIYARPEVAKWLDQKVVKLLNDKEYGWVQFYNDIKKKGITIWGAAVDTLENTTRFAKGDPTGPMTILHIFNQPLNIVKPYEGYMGNLLLPNAVVDAAVKRSIMLNFHTPRVRVLEAIQAAYPGIESKNIHVWTLGGKSRVDRIGELWNEWKNLGVHVVEEGWKLPTGMEAFTESGTYAPTYMIKAWEENGQTHLFFCDGYAASAEAMQASSLAPLFGIRAFLSVFTSMFHLPYIKEKDIMSLDPDVAQFDKKLEELIGKPLDEKTIAHYKAMIHEALDAGLPVKKHAIEADDFFPEKHWEVLAITGYMCPEPYTGAPGVELVGSSADQKIYRVTVRMVGKHADKRITFMLRLSETEKESRLIFKPLLNRFLAGEDYTTRAVRISDSGRIRNELQTLCSEALEFIGDKKIRIYFKRIPPDVISHENQGKLLGILKWYKQHHPIWFSWLEIESDLP